MEVMTFNLFDSIEFDDHKQLLAHIAEAKEGGHTQLESWIRLKNAQLGRLKSIKNR